MKTINASSKMTNYSEILLWAFLASCFVIINVAVADGNITKLPTNCTLVGDYYECQATGNVSGNSTFFISNGNLESCPYTCCINEANYTDKNCTAGYACANNKCVKIGTSVQQTCPYSCCINEVNYTDKNCTSGYQCKNNKCMPISTGIPTPETDYTVFIIIGAGLVLIILVLCAYMILKKSRSGKPSKNFDELYRKYGKKQKSRRVIRRSRR